MHPLLRVGTILKAGVRVRVRVRLPKLFPSTTWSTHLRLPHCRCFLRLESHLLLQLGVRVRVIGLRLEYSFLSSSAAIAEALNSDISLSRDVILSSH